MAMNIRAVEAPAGFVRGTGRSIRLARYQADQRVLAASATDTSPQVSATASAPATRHRAAIVNEARAAAERAEIARKATYEAQLKIVEAAAAEHQRATAAARLVALKRERSDAIWERAYGLRDRRSGAAAKLSPPALKSQAIWDRAYAVSAAARA